MKKASIKKQFIDTQVKTFQENDPEGGGMINKHYEVLSLIEKYSVKEDKVLDIGCSDGKILKMLESLGYKNLYGVDIQEVSKNSFTNTKIKYAVCDIEEDEVPFKNKFDLIIISDVLEHLFSPQTVLFKLKNKLTKKGRIIFSVPNAGWFLNGILLTFFPSKLFVSTAFGPWGHTYHYTFYQMGKSIGKLKYKILELRGGRMDNYAFKKGIKKVFFDVFVLLSYPLIKIWPNIFSAHIFGVIENTPYKPDSSAKFDVGV